MTTSPDIQSRDEWKSLGFQHGADCACMDCINHLQSIALKSVPIEQQIEAVVEAISDFDALELLPVLRTLQFVRDNQEAIRSIARNKRQQC